MTNKEIANQFSLLSKLMELHGENAFKTKTYLNAYNNIRRMPEVLADLSSEERLALPAIGKSVGAKIDELLSSGRMVALEEYVDKTPPGILDIINIRGLGPKKVKLLWQELGIESATELLYACQENRLIEIKGFGTKSQSDIASRVEYFLASRDKYIYARVEGALIELQECFVNMDKGEFTLVGDAARKCQVVDEIKFIYKGESDLSQLAEDDRFQISEKGEDYLKIRYLDQVNFTILYGFNNYTQAYLKETLGEALYKELSDDISDLVDSNLDSALKSLKLKDVPLECWDWKLDDLKDVPYLITNDDIKGVVHAHTTYSDGSATLKKMADASRKKGYEYLVVTDHSKAAFYAGGLSEDEIILQSEEIDKLNKKYSDFKILKGIECDILSDGSMDYTADVLSAFDVVIASIHSNLKMTEEKAMMRLIKAIENPNTHILGHMTSRLLLAREGYPVDHEKIIDACAANGMIIELNANPYRLDMDYRWIRFAQSRGVMISINPDAHSILGIDDISYGVLAARKGGLQKANCLNAKPIEEFMSIIGQAE